MSRLRKFDNEILNQMLQDEEDENGDFGMSFLPMDTEEQEDLIQKLELRNNLKNDSFLRVLTVIYLVCCGMFVLLATKIKRKDNELFSHKKILLFSAQSISCSIVNLRYDFFQNLLKVRRMKMRFSFTNTGLNILNFVILIFLSWIIHNQIHSVALILLLHIPHVLFIASVVVKKLITSFNFEIGQLRSLQYKFKNV